MPISSINSIEYDCHSFGFEPDPRLPLVVKWTIEAGNIEVDEHDDGSAYHWRVGPDVAKLIDAWRTSYPKLTVWEDAISEGFAQVENGGR